MNSLVVSEPLPQSPEFPVQKCHDSVSDDSGAGYPHLCGRTDQNPLESPEGI